MLVLYIRKYIFPKSLIIITFYGMHIMMYDHYIKVDVQYLIVKSLNIQLIDCKYGTEYTNYKMIKIFLYV